ncbi:MAG TPA: hypothetical protein VHN82_05495 [Methanoregula sp.]|nr:hypothetical protein [Methanoregula sp.]
MENRKQHGDRFGENRPHDQPDSRDPSGEVSAAIQRLKSRSNRGLITIVTFIAVSMLAAANLSSLPSVPASVRHSLGAGPPATMISALLIVYSFSAILTSLSRMTTGSGKYGGVTHIGYLAGFYFFYFFSGSRAENFWAVFVAGLTILGLEAYQRWNWCREEIRRLQESPFQPPYED